MCYIYLNDNTLHTYELLLMAGNSTPSPSHLYYSHSWLPQHIQVELKSDGQVNINKLEKPDETLPIIDSVSCIFVNNYFIS